jgi:hypothetical protein
VAGSAAGSKLRRAGGGRGACIGRITTPGSARRNWSAALLKQPPRPAEGRWATVDRDVLDVKG